MLPGVYRLPGVPDGFDTRLWAVVLWMGDRGHFFGPTAGYILRFDGIERPDRITIAMHSGITLQGVEVLKLRRGDRPQCRHVEGFRICRTERVLAEMAATLGPGPLGRALDDALRRGMTTLEKMSQFADKEWRYRPGRTLLLKLLKQRDDRDERIRSMFEARMLRILRRIKSERFEADHELDIDGERFVLDFFHPLSLIGIECHSYKFHIGKHNEDARRDRKLASAGIELLYFTWADLHDDDRRVEREIRAAIERKMGVRKLFS